MSYVMRRVLQGYLADAHNEANQDAIDEVTAQLRELDESEKGNDVEDNSSEEATPSENPPVNPAPADAEVNA